MKKHKGSKGENIFDFFNTSFMIILCIITLYPIWYVVIYSFNEGVDAIRGGIYLFPREFTLQNYLLVFSRKDIMGAYGISVLRVLVGMSASVMFTSIVGYGMSKTDLIGKKIYMTIGTGTLLLNAGLIPSFLLIKSLGLIDHFAVYIIPHLFSFYNMVLLRTYYLQLPGELSESAKIDGAGDFRIFFKIIFPLSMPIIAVIALFNGVYHWNDYVMGLFYIHTQSLTTVQTYLYKLLAVKATLTSLQAMAGAADFSAQTSTPSSIKLATLVVTTVPVVLVYPFLQKYFVKGILIGTVKG